MISSRHSGEALPPQLVQSLRLLFDQLDVEKSGYIRFSTLRDRWQAANPDLRGLPKGFMYCLRQVTPPNGMLTFERFCTGLRLALAASQPMKKRAGDTTSSSSMEGSPPPPPVPPLPRNHPAQKRVHYLSTPDLTIEHPSFEEESFQKPRITRTKNFEQIMQNAPPHVYANGGNEVRLRVKERPQSLADTNGVYPFPPAPLHNGMKKETARIRPSSVFVLTEHQSDQSARVLSPIRFLKEHSPPRPRSSEEMTAQYDSRPPVAVHNLPGFRPPAQRVVIPPTNQTHRTTNGPVVRAQPPPYQRAVSQHQQSSQINPKQKQNGVANGPRNFLKVQPSSEQSSHKSSNSTSPDSLNSVRNGHHVPVKQYASHDGFLDRLPPHQNGGVRPRSASRGVPNGVNHHQLATQYEQQPYTNGNGHDSDGSDGGPEQISLRHKRLLDEEKEIIRRGLEASQKLHNWYTERLQALETKQKLLGKTMVPLDYAVHEEKLNYLRAHVTELNRRATAVMESSDKGFPNYMNVENNKHIPQPADDQVMWLKKQNKMLTEEVCENTNKVVQLEKEKSVLLRQLFNHSRGQETYTYTDGHARATLM